MAAPPADRILEVVGDDSARLILRALSQEERTQAALVSSTKMSQSVVSRTVTTLRMMGLIASDSPRGVLRIRAPAATDRLLLAANNLAKALMAVDAEEQGALDDQTLRGAIKPARETAEDIPRAGQ